jgi:hypothetical protein
MNDCPSPSQRAMSAAVLQRGSPAPTRPFDLRQPQYDFLFAGGARRFVDQSDPLRQITISPSREHPGYWHVERWISGIIEKTNRPMLADGLSYFLKRWQFPPDKDQWKAIAEFDDRDELPESASDLALLRAFKVVYFLQAGPFIKIGYTSCPLKSRIEQLKTGCPYEIVPLATMAGDITTERQLHRRFQKYRANLEWFHACEQLIGFIRENAVMMEAR